MAKQIGTPERGERLELLNRRTERLITLATKEIASAPSSLSELLLLFDRQPVDLSLIKRMIDNQPGLSSQILRYCNATVVHEHHRLLDLEEVAVLLGCESMKQIVLRSFLLDCARRWLSRTDLRRFWRHSILTATLSERIAHLLGRGPGDPLSQYAYLGGMFHDIGWLPLLVISADENAVWETPRMCSSSLVEEKKQFGFNHCEVAQIMAPYWNVFPGCSEIIAHHHTPGLTPCNQDLVGVVAAADIVCESYELAPAGSAASHDGFSSPSRNDLFASCFPNLGAEARAELAELLEEELLRLAHLPELKREVFIEIFGQPT